MINKMPRTPFSTQLSKSAKETEIRIRNIFSGPKKRPPVLLIVLIALLILLCGNLVAFRPLPVKPTLIMETQYYDANGNYIEIPALALPAGEKNEAVEAINMALNDLRRQYSGPLSGSNDFREEQCLFYPSTTGRYLNLVFFRSRFTTDLNTGHVFSLVYDLREGTLVPAEDALALAGLNEKGLLDQVAGQIQTQIDRESREYGFQLALHNLTLEGFRVKADGQPVFYLTGRVDDVDDEVLDAISGADRLYIWEDRAVTVYDQYSVDKSPLVPAGETDRLDPPLWCQWYFAGEEPQGGFAQIAQPLPELYDPEVCLYRDGDSNPVGPGSGWLSLFEELYPNAKVQVLDSGYYPGDYWDEWDAGELTVQRYYSAETDSFSINSLDVTRTDLYTPKGIRVGSTRTEVLAAYPTAIAGNYWDIYPGEDLVYYIPGLDPETSDGFWSELGPALVFLFDGDTVKQIGAQNMFN